MAIGQDERTQLREMVRDLMQAKSDESALRRVITTPERFDRALWSEMAELGILGIVIDERYGGTGLGPVELELIAEETGAALLSSPLLGSSVLTATLIATAGDEAARERLLPGLAAGSTIGAAALTGSAGTWTPDGVEVTAAPDGRLTGIARFVLYGQAADVVIVAARGDDGIGVYEIDPAAAGVTRTPHDLLDPTVQLSEFAFDGAASTRLGTAGWEAVQRALDLGTIALAGEQAGGARRVFDISVDYLKTRYQFGRPIGSYQAMKHLAADRLVDVESAISAARNAAQVADGGEDAEGAIALAGFACGDLYDRVAMNAIQFHGGMGYTWESFPHFFLRRARLDRQLLGSPARFRERYLVSKGA